MLERVQNSFDLKVTFLGTGTSQGVPVIACDCHVCLSTDSRDNRLRSSVLIEYDRSVIVIDTGPDFRYQMLGNNVKHLDAVIMTHAHKDHTAGMDDVRAFNHKQQSSIPVFGSKTTLDALRKEFYYAFTEEKYPGVPRLELNEIVAGNSFKLVSKDIMPVEVLHHKLSVYGYRIDKFAYITDAKTISEESFQLLEGVETLVLNALQREPHISHLTMEEAIDVAQKIGAKHTYFTHISHRFGCHEELLSWLPKGISVAYDGLVLNV